MTVEQEHPEVEDAAAEERLATILSSKVRAALLCWMVPRPDVRASLTELSRETGIAISSLQHECYKLVRIGVLADVREGQSRLYSLRLDAPFSRALVALVVSALGLEAAIWRAMATLGSFETVTLAFPPGDGRVVLVVVGSADLESLSVLQTRIALLLGIDPEAFVIAYYEVDAWRSDMSARARLVGRLRGYTMQRVRGAWPLGDAFVES